MSWIFAKLSQMAEDLLERSVGRLAATSFGRFCKKADPFLSQLLHSHPVQSFSDGAQMGVHFIRPKLEWFGKYALLPTLGAGTVYRSVLDYYRQQNDALCNSQNLYMTDSAGRHGMCHVLTSASIAGAVSPFASSVLGEAREVISVKNYVSEEGKRDSWKDRWNNNLGLKMQQWLERRNLDTGTTNIYLLLLDAQKQGGVITSAKDPRIDLEKNPFPDWQAPSDTTIFPRVPHFVATVAGPR